MTGHLTHPGADSYRPEAEHGGLDAEARRLDQQAALTWEHEWRVLRDLAPARGRILDAGCGTGSFTRLLRRELPAAGITGLDADPRLLARAAFPPTPAAGRPAARRAAPRPVLRPCRPAGAATSAGCAAT
jgi:SAM-dependent methyltransferase